MVNRTNVLIAILFLIIIVLAGVMVYAFVVKPTYTGYVIEKQIEGENICVAKILTQLQQNGFVQIPIGNQTLYLAPFNPGQVQQPTGQ